MSVAAEARAERRRVRLSPRAGILALVVVALVLYLSIPLRTYLAQRAALDRLERQTALLQEQNDRLQQEIEQLHDPRYLERVARECLGMVKPGEVAFVVVPKGGTVPPARC